MMNFCTLFDSNYLSKGLALYHSLEKVCDDFHLYIFAFDDLSLRLLKEMNLKFATIISLKELESEKLLNIKSTRNVGEYCWTCKGPAIRYCFDNFDIDSCTYIDSDLYFYSNPKEIFDEIGDNDVMLTEHRFTKDYDLSETNGKFCAGYMYFRKSENGQKILDWWTNLCIDWCYAYHAPGKFGDQKYLDIFMENYPKVCDLKNLGGGVAPWNVQQYEFLEKDGKLIGITKKDKKEFKLIFYHFHFLKITRMKFLYEFYIGPYFFSNSDIRLIYKPYFNELIELNNRYSHLSLDLSRLMYMDFKLSYFRFFGHIIKTLFLRNKMFYFKIKK